MNKYFKNTIISGKNIPIYNSSYFSKLQEAGLLAYKTLKHVEKFIKEGISTLELNDICHDFMLRHNAIPATLGYNGFPKSSCISLNDVICHGIPSSNTILKNGDILNIDVTVILNGWYGDTSCMYTVGNISPTAQKLIDVTKQCLDEAINIVKPGVHLGTIGHLIEEIAHKNNFSVVEEFCGHGIGRKFHHEPNILHYGKKDTGLQLKPGMVFTIEPMINEGTKHSIVMDDNWTAKTKDGSLSAQFEHMIGVTEKGCVIFTKP